MSYTTINFRGVELDIKFDYQPEEPMVRYYSDGSGYPGCGAEMNIESITHKGTDMWDLVEVHIKEIENEALESYIEDNQPEY